MPELLPSDAATRPLGRSRDRLGLWVAATIVAVILGVYGAGYLNGQWAAGHPVVGLMWLFIAYMTLRRATRPDPGPRIMYWVTLAFALVGGIIWTAATLWPQGG